MAISFRIRLSQAGAPPDRTPTSPERKTCTPLEAQDRLGVVLRRLVCCEQTRMVWARFDDPRLVVGVMLRAVESETQVIYSAAK